MYKATIGTISHATMRSEDLIPCFIEELEKLDYKNEFTEVIKEGKEIIEQAEKNEEIWDKEYVTEFLNEDLWNALDSFSPPYCNFGANEGDGSDYGFWPYITDIIEEFEGLKVSDLSEVPEDYQGDILLINDHGNTSLYYKCPYDTHEVWSIV